MDHKSAQSTEAPEAPAMHSCGHAFRRGGDAAAPCPYCQAVASDEALGLPRFTDDVGTPSRVIADASGSRREAYAAGDRSALRPSPCRDWLPARRPIFSEAT